VGAIDPLAQASQSMSYDAYRRQHAQSHQTNPAYGRSQQPAQTRHRRNDMNQQFDQNGVDVGQQGQLLGPGAIGNCNLPNLSNNIAPNCSVYQECMVPFGVRVGFDQQGNVYQPEAAGLPAAEAQSVGLLIGTSANFFADRGVLNITALRVLAPTTAGLVAIESIETGDAEFKQLDNIDATAFNTDDCGCYFPAGCFSTSNSLKIEGRSINGTEDDEVELFSCVCWCTRQASINSCGPIATCPSVVPFGPVNMAQPVAVAPMPAPAG